MTTSQTRWTLGCGITLVVLIGLGVVLVLVTAALTGQTLIMPDFRPAVAVVEVFGVIGEDDTILEQLDRVDDDDSVKAIVLDVNSPGGSVAVTQRITSRLQTFKDDGMPVVAALESVAASGAYYVACTADSILTLPGTLTGSIGAIISFPEASQLMRKLGVELQVIKTGPQKDAGGFHRPLTDEERRWLQRVLDDVESQFVDAVEQGRPSLAREEVELLADGRLFSGLMAVDLGLADRVGSLEDAIAVAETLAGIAGRARIVRKRPPTRFIERWLDEQFSGLTELARVNRSPQVEYRWR